MLRKPQLGFGVHEGQEEDLFFPAHAPVTLRSLICSVTSQKEEEQEFLYRVAQAEAIRKQDLNFRWDRDDNDVQ